MTRDEIVQMVNDCLVEEFEVEPDHVVPDARLIEDLGLDSLDFVDMVVVLQKALSVELRDNPRIREIRKVGELHDLVLELHSPPCDADNES